MNNNSNVLYVEDCPLERESRSLLFSKNGYIPTVVGNIYDAEQQLLDTKKKGSSFHLVICNTLLSGGENGFQFFELYKNSGGDPAKFILVSGRHEYSDFAKDLGIRFFWKHELDLHLPEIANGTYVSPLFP